MGAPDAGAVEQIAAETAAKMNSAKLIHCLYNPLGIIGAKQSSSTKGVSHVSISVSKCLNWIVNDFHIVTDRNCYSITNFERQKVSA